MNEVLRGPLLPIHETMPPRGKISQVCVSGRRIPRRRSAQRIRTEKPQLSDAGARRPDANVARVFRDTRSGPNRSTFARRGYFSAPSAALRENRLRRQPLVPGIAHRAELAAAGPEIKPGNITRRRGERRAGRQKRRSSGSIRSDPNRAPVFLPTRDAFSSPRPQRLCERTDSAR